MIKHEVEELVKKYIELVHTQDEELFNEVFAKNTHCKLIALSHEFDGRDEILNNFLLTLIHGRYSNIDLINDGLDINIVSDDLVIAVFKYHTECIIRDTGEPYGIAGIETQIMVKEEGKWKITHVHYSK